MREKYFKGGRWVVLAQIACLLLLAGFRGTLAAPPNQPPTVTLTSPADGASFVAPTTISLAATASDPDGTVVRVDFFETTTVNGPLTLIGSATSAPFTATWSNVPLGNYILIAKATDNAGATGNSNAVSISVSSATALVINTPVNGAAVNIDGGVAVSGTYEGTTDSTILVDDGNNTALATISGNTFAATLPLAIGPVTVTGRLNRPDNISATRTVSVTGYASPLVVFTGPSCSTFEAPASVPLAVDAKAPGGTITKVDFFQGGALLGTATAPPYTFTWNNVAAGTYTIAANAQNNFGAVGTATTTITVNGANIPPSISITSPAAGATFNAPASVPITVNATDSDGTVTLVEFFANGATIGATSVAPFGFTWSNVAAGSYSLTARATDNRNGQTTSAPVSITVNNPPTAALTSPVQGASFNAPSTVTLTATASDTDGTVVRVEFYQGTTFIGASTAAPYAASWSVFAPGTYSLTVKAFDNLGGVGVSAPVTVTVAGTVTFLHNDFAGNPIAATDGNGNLLWKENFRPYGDRLNNQTAAAGNRQWFHGKPADADTGLSYFGARYYDPTVGRFMGVDSLRFDQRNLHSFNRYAYGNNNPYKYVDVDGRFSIVEIATGIGILGLGGYIIVNSSKPALPGKQAGTDAAGSNLLTTPGESQSAGQLPGFSQLLDKLGNLIFSEKQEGNTNPYKGPVDNPVVVVDPHGNAIPVGQGEQITTSPSGDYQQIRDSAGRETGVRLDRGGHRNRKDPLARDPHAHVPGVTTPEGNQHLPINPPSD